MSDGTLRLPAGQTAQLGRARQGFATATLVRPAWTPAALFNSGLPGRWRRVGPGRVFSDTAGTTLAAPGGDAARQDDARGAAFGHDAQAVVAARPTFGRKPVGGVRNLLTQAIDYVPGVVGATYTPDSLTVGSTVYARVTETSATTSHRFSENLGSAVSGTRYAIYFRLIEDGRFMSVADNGGTTSFAVTFDAASQTATYAAGANLVAAGFTADGRCFIVFDAVATETISCQFRFVQTNNIGFQNYTGNGTSGVWIGPRAFEALASGATMPTAEQVRASDFDITEVGVDPLWYLRGSLGGKVLVSGTALDFSGEEVASIVIGLEKFTDTDSFTAFAHGAPDDGGIEVWKAGGFAEWSVSTWESGSRRSLTRSGVPAPDRAVIGAVVDRTGDIVRLRYNGVEVTPSSTTLTGPLRDAVVSILGRADGSQPFAGDYFGDVYRAGAFTDAEFAAAEAYFMTYTGVAP